MDRKRHDWFTWIRHNKIILVSVVIILIAGLALLVVESQKQPLQSARQFSTCTGCATEPMIPDNNIYTLYTNNLSAQLFTLDPHTGKPLYATTLIAGSSDQQTILNGIAYGAVGSFTAPTQLIAMRLNDYKLLWEYNAGPHDIRIAIATPGMLYIIRDNKLDTTGGKADGNNNQTTSLLAINAANGKVVWQYDFSQETDNLLLDGNTIITWNETIPTSTASPGQMNNAATNNVLTITALRADNGSALWSHNLQDISTTGNAIPPVAVNQQLFIAYQPDQDHSQIIEFNDQNGQTLWQGQVEKSETITSLAIATGNLAIITNKNGTSNTTATLYVRPLNRTTFTWSYTATNQQSDLQWTIVNDTAYAMWSVVDPHTFAQHRVVAAWHISNGQKLWQATTNMTNKLVNLNIFPHQVLLNDIQGVDVEARQISTGAQMWHIKLPQKNTVQTTRIQNTIISKNNLYTSVVTPSEYVQVSSYAFEAAGYGLSMDAQKAQTVIYIATHITNTDNTTSNNNDLDRLYALDMHNGHILWQRDPSTLYQATLSNLPTPTPMPIVKPVLRPTHGIHDFTNFVGGWYNHNGGLLFKANGDAELDLKAQGCKDGPACEGKNAMINIHFNSATGDKAIGTITASGAYFAKLYKVGTTITATLEDDDTVFLDKIGLGFCGPKSPSGYCGA